MHIIRSECREIAPLPSDLQSAAASSAPAAAATAPSAAAAPAPPLASLTWPRTKFNVIQWLDRHFCAYLSQHARDRMFAKCPAYLGRLGRRLGRLNPGALGLFGVAAAFGLQGAAHLRGHPQNVQSCMGNTNNLKNATFCYLRW